MTDPIIVIGGGLAAGTAVGKLRLSGYDGPLVLFTDEPRAPYERPPLSKAYLMGKDPAEKAFVHAPEWYAEHDVDLRTASHVESIDLAQQTVRVGQDDLAYDKLLIATGARPRHLEMADASGVPTTYLRTLDDSTRLREELQEGRRIAIIGGGWIGLEVASAALEAGCEVVVLEALEQPLVRVLGPEVAAVFADMHRDHGVDLRTEVSVEAISAAGDGAELTLGDGSSVTCDHLVVGVGVTPAVELAEAAGLVLDNGIRTDAHLRTSDPHVFAAGDVANADHPALGHPIRVEHWDTAIQHGKVAAANLLGGDAVADALPYFFTDQYDFGMEYVGNPGPEGYDDVVLRGDVPGRVFTAWWLRGDLVVAGMHANDWDAIEQVRRLVGRRVDPDALRDESVSLGDVAPKS
jgi:3-phenylpropionate/trans-cinnamate dioxygenase ferredoxin reductase subunit